MSNAPLQTSARVRLNDPLYAEVLEWLIEEAELLDHNEFEAWLARLASDVRYVMPVRSTVYRSDGDGISTTFSHFDDNYESMWVRIQRLVEGKGFAEDPPSRTRRFVSNLRVAAPAGGEIEAASYLLLLRSRGDASDYEMISCERNDRLRRDDTGNLVLVTREILVDQTKLGMSNLSVFL